MESVSLSNASKPIPIGWSSAASGTAVDIPCVEGGSLPHLSLLVTLFELLEASSSIYVVRMLPAEVLSSLQFKKCLVFNIFSSLQF